jgi:hypothetical protein
VEKAMIERRFDKYCRAERFFSATLLPALFLANNFKGLKSFIELLRDKRYFPVSEHAEGEISYSYDNLLSKFDWRNVHFATEVNLERDLTQYKIPINPNAFLKKKERKQETPDIVVVLDDLILILECKFYSAHCEHDIDKQLERQKYVFDIISDFYRNPVMGKIHVCIAPDDIRVTNGYVVTWKQIFDLYKDTPGSEFVLNILKSHVEVLNSY